jgi:hypothetical protein
MAATPTFISTPRLSVVNVATANTARDGSGTIVELIAGVAAGTKVLEVVAQAAISGTVTAGMVTLFTSTDGGSTWRLFDEIAIAAASSAVAVKATRNTATYSNLVLIGTNHRLGAATTIAQSVNVAALAGDLT